MRWLQSLVVAMSMYTRIPMPRIEWKKENMRYAICFFPLAGAAVGILVWLWYQAAFFLPVGVLLKTAVFVLIPVLVSGGIHLDGLLDTADALSSWQTREQRLAILKDSHAGAFAVIAGCSYFVAAFGIWSQADAPAVAVLGLGFCLSRALSGFGICTFPHARPDGTAAAFSGGEKKRRCRWILLAQSGVCMGVMLLLDVRRGILAAGSAVVVCLLCRRMAVRKFGGITGDIQGFFLQLCELAMAYAVILGGRIWY